MVYTYEKFLLELGAKVRQMRKDRGWTLRDMIARHGFHLAQWQGFEKGKGISVPSLLRLCSVFELTLEELIANLGREPSPAAAAPSPTASARSGRGKSAPAKQVASVPVAPASPRQRRPHRKP